VMQQGSIMCLGRALQQDDAANLVALGDAEGRFDVRLSGPAPLLHFVGSRSPPPVIWVLTIRSEGEGAMKRLVVSGFATLALVLGLSGPASAASPQASCQAIVNSSFAGQPGARAVELQSAFEEAADRGVPVGAVLSEFSRVHGGSIEGCFV
jgi:hypothetical protein